MVQYKDGRSFVMADIPGLIEGASDGAGLGDQFLRHIERCRILIHLVDLSAEGPQRSPVKDWQTINRELSNYSPALARKPQIIAANKMDLPVARKRYPRFAQAMKRRGQKVLPISAATGEGLSSLLDATAEALFRTLGTSGQRAAARCAHGTNRTSGAASYPHLDGRSRPARGYLQHGGNSADL
jgi:GTP-binding protein